jgi:SAM-dependent methyltransferase
MNPVAGGGDPAEYGDRIADVYDEWHGQRDQVGPVVEFLAAWAAGGPALELGIGTGRIALPLAARGIRVDGIDASARMVERLRAKPGGAELAVSVGDFAGVPAPGGPYGLVYVVFNTFFALLTQAAASSGSGWTGSTRARPASAPPCTTRPASGSAPGTWC